MTRLLIVFCLVALALLGRGCDNQPPVSVDLSKRSTETVPPHPADSQLPIIRLGIGAIITAKEGYIYYRRLADYLEKQLAIPVSLIDRGTYQEYNELLATGGLDVAFVCGGPYVEGRKTFQLELLAIPETSRGETVYYSYLIVPSESPARTLEDLRGRKFAFTDPLSNTGRLVPTYLLARRSEVPEQFFGELIYTFAHDKSILAVASQQVDGAAVDSLIYDYLANINPGLIAKTRILEISEPYGIPPMVVRPDLPAPLKEQLRSILLQMHADPEGQNILKGMMISRFVTADDAAYDSIREIERFILQLEQQ